MNKKINDILDAVKQNLEGRKKVTSLEKLMEEVTPVNSTFREQFKRGKKSIIAEIKIISPSVGVLGDPGQLINRALAYEEGGAVAISIITEKSHFGGEFDFIQMVKSQVQIPVLQKDFVIDEYQIYEAAALESDALLLIARIVSEKELIEFVDLAINLGVEPVVEVFNKEDLEKALKTSTKMIAVNARDLDTLEVHTSKAAELLKEIPEKFIKLAFSGVNGLHIARKYFFAGADGILVGTSLMQADNIKVFLENLND